MKVIIQVVEMSTLEAGIGGDNKTVSCLGKGARALLVLMLMSMKEMEAKFILVSSVVRAQTTGNKKYVLDWELKNKDSVTDALTARMFNWMFI